MANIATINKGKGKLSDLDSDRGIFRLTILRMIIDKLIYLEEYNTVDKNMSDSKEKKKTVRIIPL